MHRIMSKFLKTLLGFLFIATLVIACTKSIGLFTEVEFEVSEQYAADGYVNNPLAITLTVLPEVVSEEVTYSYRIESLVSSGSLSNNQGNIIETGDTVDFIGLTADFLYTGIEEGNHTLTLTVTDNYGFTKKITLEFSIENVPLTWLATSTVTQIELGSTAQVNLLLENQIQDTNVNFQTSYELISGTGTLTGFPTANDEFPQQFTAIAPGTYQLVFDAEDLGTMELLFRLRDSNGQELTTSLTLEVVEEIVDEQPPIITIIGNNPMEVFVGGTYADEGATASDNVDGDITNEIITDASAVNTGTEGSYEVVYTVSDSNSNTTTAVRQVNVVPDPNGVDVAVTNINITQTNLSLVEGSTGTLTVVVDPNNATNQGINWASNNPAVATVNASGIVTAVAEGEAIITATSQENATLFDTATIMVTITAIAVTGLDITQPSLDLVEGAMGTLTAVISPADATDQGIDWATNNPAVATVDASGTVTAVAQGNAIITATSQDDNTVFDTATIAVTVGTVPVTGLDITQPSLDLVEGAMGTLTAVISPADATDQGIDWATNNPAVATVDASGTVTAVAQGNAIITATSQDDNTVFDTATIAVTVGTVPVTGLDITQPSLDLVEGAMGTLTAVISPADATDQGIDWATNNPAVATVDASGTVTAVAQGNAIITATSQDDNTVFDTATIAVTVGTVPVTGLDITQPSLDLVEGLGTLTAVISPVDATDQGIDWATNNPAVATVDAWSRGERHYHRYLAWALLLTAVISPAELPPIKASTGQPTTRPSPRWTPRGRSPQLPRGTPSSPLPRRTTTLFSIRQLLR